MATPTDTSGQDELKPSKSGELELRAQARLVKELTKLPINGNSSALFTVDLWAVAEFITTHETQLLESLVAEQVEGENVYEAEDVVDVIPVSAVERVIKELKGGV